MKVTVIDGDITQVKADALITVVDAGLYWRGSVDEAIMRVAGNSFHNALSRWIIRSDVISSAVRILGPEYHKGRFSSVIFVVDDLAVPIGDLVFKGLDIAIDSGLESVSISPFRHGVMEDVVETHSELFLPGFANAISLYAGADDSKFSLKEITIVIHDDPDTFEYLQKEFRSF